MRTTICAAGPTSCTCGLTRYRIWIPRKYTTVNYFPLLKTSATDGLGRAGGQIPFHLRHFDLGVTGDSRAVRPATGSISMCSPATPPRNIVVAYIDPNATGTAATLGRGAAVQSIDGVGRQRTILRPSVDTLNAGLQPATVGEMHTFVVLDVGSMNSPHRRADVGRKRDRDAGTGGDHAHLERRQGRLHSIQ